MVHEPLPLDITNNPDLARLAEEVQRTRTPRLLQRDGEDLALLTPAEQGGEPTETAEDGASQDDERDRVLALLDELAVHRAAMLAARGGVSLAESWPLIREERELRSRELDERH